MSLKNIQRFNGIPENQIIWLEENGQIIQLNPGDFLIKPGDPIDNLFLLLRGKIAFRIKQGNQFKTLSYIEKEGITGFLPYSRAKEAMGYGEAIENCEVFKLSKAKCKEMATKFYELTAIFVHEMTSRTREFTRSNLQSEKMMALGKLSAGLAHELNNPASAIARSALELRRHLGSVPEKFKRAMTVKASAELIDIVNKLLIEKIKNSNNVEMNLLERSDLESELEDWFDDHDIENGFELTDVLVDHQFKVEDLQKIWNSGSNNDFSPTIDWIANVLTTEKMVEEIQDAAERISGIVKSVKSYTHMDQAPERIPSDVRQGIRSTLTMLNHKLKAKKIAVKVEFPEDLKHPCIIVNEINQVWTNIIDNAIDAVENEGIITIKAFNYNEFVRILINDNGSGIPKEIINRIFDPFFTTKAIGEGTGMGLELVYRIIDQHQGKISVSSDPGDTTFTIDLPLD